MSLSTDYLTSPPDLRSSGTEIWQSSQTDIPDTLPGPSSSSSGRPEQPQQFQPQELMIRLWAATQDNIGLRRAAERVMGRIGQNHELLDRNFEQSFYRFNSLLEGLQSRRAEIEDLKFQLQTIRPVNEAAETQYSRIQILLFFQTLVFLWQSPVASAIYIMISTAMIMLLSK
ncbi:hypothetical protein SISNIDRAFT_491849 [Sistotremastrum niveocremeum HHB9708]|uniref:Uncharacterized protein n=1 Tax=Sistotremastrum niveocremeum HHB9708 TaxID=1314777 RepID=A0A164MBL5_9AGAM|nr:hypothetical protein SISNIDRAFT_491849 [Sistotremastrum niveocremeum HHB9708]